MNGQTFGKYQLIKKLATGGMAEVWLARHTGIEGFQRMLVVKRILPHLADDPEFIRMFLNEAKIAARFNHPNIAQIYDLGETNGTYYIAMEFIHGEDLGRVMRRAWSTGQWIARPLAIRIVASACEGLYYAHTKADDRGSPLKVVHRDISPQNILVSFDGSVKVVDFGIAKAADAQSMTRSGAIKGKFAYMAPEQAAGKVVDHRSDIFALGLVLYEMLTGVRPLKRDGELATLQAALECAIEPPSKVADVPADLDSVVMAALAKAADDRYRDARALQMALEEFLVSQRWVATSVQISELMSTLFHDRLEEEARLGYPDPVIDEGSATSAPAEPSAPSGNRSQPSRSTAEMSWDAPPGAPVVPSSGRATARGLAKNYQRDSGDRKVIAPPENVREWEAPPATEVPGRRTTSETRGTEAAAKRVSSDQLTALARPSRTDLRAAERPGPPSRSSTRTEAVEPPEQSPRRTRTGQHPGPPSRTGQPAVRRRTSEALAEPEEPLDEETFAREEVPPPRRRTSGQFSLAGSRRPSQAHELPEPPPRAPPEQGERRRRARAPKEEELDLSGLVDPHARTSRFRLAALLGTTLLLGAVGWGFWEQLEDFLLSKPGDEIFVSVESNVYLEVYVEHAPSENRKERTHLGTTPVKRGRGAHLGDTLVFENRPRGVKHREELTYGQPGEHRQIRHEVVTGFFTLRFEPAGLKDLGIYLNGEQVGQYPGPKLELAEGTHTLEVRGPRLSDPAQIEVEVKPRTNSTKVFNLSSLLH